MFSTNSILYSVYYIFIKQKIKRLENNLSRRFSIC